MTASTATVFLVIIALTIREHLRLLSGIEGLLLQNDEPLGGDFIAFYTGSKLLYESFTAETLYSFSNQMLFQSELLGVSANELPFLPFVYPPIVALIFIPFSFLSLPQAFCAWSLTSFILFLLGLELVIRALDYQFPFSRMLFYLGAVAFTPFTIETLAGGQLSAIGVFILGVAFYLIRKERFFSAGLTTSFLYFKAPLFILLIISLLLILPRRFLGGLAIGGAFIICAEVLCLGINGILHYTRFVLIYLQGQTPTLDYTLPSSLGMGIFSLLQDYSPYALYFTILCSIAWLFLFAQNVRKNLFSMNDAFSLSLIASIGLSIQVNNYDLSLLTIPLLIIISSLHQENKQLFFGKLLILMFICFHAFFLIFERYNLPILVLLVFLVCLTALRHDHNRGVSTARLK